MPDMRYTEVNTGNIYEAYDIIRKKSVGRCAVLAGLSLILFPLIGGIRPEDWLNLFYGINIMYLFIILAMWAMFLSQVYCMVTKWDKRQIEKQLILQGINKDIFEENMDKGRIFFQNGTDSMFVSSEYCIIAGRGRYSVVRSRDIYKLGIDTVSNGKVNMPRLMCLMRNGKKYTLMLRQSVSLEIAEYLKNVLIQ